MNNTKKMEKTVDASMDPKLVDAYLRELSFIAADRDRRLRPLGKLLAAAGAAVEPKKAFGLPGLFLMAKAGNREAVAAMLAAGFNPSHRFDDERTPAMDAAMAGHPECLRLLLAAGASPDAVSERGRAVAAYALEGPAPLECIKILGEFGARFCENSRRAEPPVFIAAAIGDVGSLELMLKFNGEAPCFFSGISLFEWASAHGQHAIARAIERHEVSQSAGPAASAKRAARI